MDPIFFCDAGLGGLARWLRAAGYVAHWRADFDDGELVRLSRDRGGILLTTDGPMMERRLLRDKIVRSLWLPPTLQRAEQLRRVLGAFALPVREPRCMGCGGELHAVEKESVRERIPPKTYAWLDAYFECAECHRLFWHGTHWKKISATLRSSAISA